MSAHPITLQAERVGRKGAHYTGAKPAPQELEDLYIRQLLGSGKIARHYGVTRKTVTNWLEQVGIARRSGQEAGLLRFEASAKFVPPDERENCLLDRAWEARPGRRINDRVACRLCFMLVSRLTGKSDFATLIWPHRGRLIWPHPGR